MLVLVQYNTTSDRCRDCDLVLIGLLYKATRMVASIVTNPAEAKALPREGALALVNSSQMWVLGSPV